MTLNHPASDISFYPFVVMTGIKFNILIFSIEEKPVINILQNHLQILSGGERNNHRILTFRPIKT